MVFVSSDEKVQENGTSLIIENIVSQDGGNYTCTADSTKIDHEITVINFPMYTISTVVLYNIDKCAKEDCDILSVHFPDILGEVICGTNIIICRPNVKSARCVRKTVKDYLALSLMIDVEPFNVIFPTLNSTACDVNCQVKMYSNVLSIITKNTESFQKMPGIFSYIQIQFD